MMSVALRKAMTVGEFLAWEERQELRYEFDGFAPMAMTGGSLEHSAIERNLITALTVRLRGKQEYRIPHLIRHNLMPVRPDVVALVRLEKEALIGFTAFGAPVAGDLSVFDRSQTSV